MVLAAYWMELDYLVVCLGHIHLWYHMVILDPYYKLFVQWGGVMRAPQASDPDHRSISRDCSWQDTLPHLKGDLILALTCNVSLGEQVVELSCGLSMNRLGFIIHLSYNSVKTWPLWRTEVLCANSTIHCYPFIEMPWWSGSFYRNELKVVFHCFSEGWRLYPLCELIWNLMVKQLKGQDWATSLKTKKHARNHVVSIPGSVLFSPLIYTIAFLIVLWRLN